MTQNEIIHMARKAGFSDHYLSTVQLHDLENFAALVAAHEREKQAEQEPIEGVLPCPFCGCTDVSVNEGSTFRWRYAMCDNCGAQAGEVRFDTLAAHTEAAEKQAHKEAIEEWNNRAAPVHTKDLTDDEIHKLVKQVRFDGMTDKTFQFARAVIAADREKNK